LPMLVYSTVRVGVNPQINVIGTLIITGVALIVTATMFRGQAGVLAANRAPGPGRGPR